MSADGDYCLTEVREGDRDRYLALLFSATTVRADLAAIAAFNLELARSVSDITESMMGLVRLQWWREALEEIRAGGALRRHPVVAQLASATRRHGLPIDRMMAMVAAREDELESEGPPNQAAFDSRADATAANVLRLSLTIAGFDPSEQALAAASAEIGRGYATVGCARSVLIDARRRRVRLPAERLAEAGVDLDKLFDLRPQPQLTACLRAVGAAVAADLDAGRRRRIGHGARPLTVTGKLVALHLERLRQVAYDPFDPGVVTTQPFDVWRLLWTAITGRF